MNKKVIFTCLNLLLLSNAVTTRKDKSILYSRTTFIILSYSLFLTYYLIDWFFLTKSIGLFNGLIYCKLYTLFFIFFIFAISSFILVLTSFYPRKVWMDNFSSFYHLFSLKLNYNTPEILDKKSEHYQILEYPLIILFVITGGVTLLSSNDFVTIFLTIELQSYGLYLLAAIYRNSEQSTSAGLTYFLLGGLSSCIILLGLSLLYVNIGNTSLEGLYIIHNIFINNSTTTNLFFFTNQIFDSSISNLYQYSFQLSLVIFSTGFLFKISSAPFHSWSPGVYDAIPTVTTTFVAIVAKISILILLIEIVHFTSYTTLNFSWKNALLFSSFLSLIIGSVLGLTQFRIKKLYAYSTISHIGFILLAFCVNTMESIQAFFFYLIQYSFSNLNAFIILIAIGYSYKTYKKTDSIKTTNFSYENLREIEKENKLSPIEYIDQMKGYFYINPLLAISFSITLYSFIGVPPLVGFFAKQMILSSALDNGYVFMTLIAILTSVISAVYYLFIVKHLFFEKSEYIINDKFNNNDMILLTKNQNKKIQFNAKDIVLSSSLTCIISILTWIILSFIFIYTEIYSLVNLLTLVLIY